MKRMTLATYIVSTVGIALFMSHFWVSYPACAALWSLAGASGIFCLYAGIIHRSQVENATHKAVLTAAAVIGGVIMLGITLSAIFLFVPRM